MRDLLKEFDQFVWSDDLGALSRFRHWLVSVLRTLYAVVQELLDGQLTLRAMSLVYTTLLSIVPLLAFSFSVLKGFGVHNQFEPLLSNLLEPLGEKGEALTKQVIGFVDNMRVGVLGALGLSLLIYTVISLLQKIEQSLNYIWRVSAKRSFAQRFSEYLSVLLVGPVLVFSALGITGSLMHTRFIETIVAAEASQKLISTVVTLAPYALVIIAFTFIYKFVPYTKVKLRSALAGAAVAGVLWETVGWAFASFVANSTKYMAIYSGFAIVIMAMIWIYLSWLILLIGASIAFYHQNPQYRIRRSNREPTSVKELEKLGVRVLLEISKTFEEGDEPLDLRRLATQLSARSVDVERALRAFAASKILVATSQANPAYLPARPLDRITVEQALDAIRSYPDGLGRESSKRGRQDRIDELLVALDEFGYQNLGHKDFKTLLRDLDVSIRPAARG